MFNLLYLAFLFHANRMMFPQIPYPGVSGHRDGKKWDGMEKSETISKEKGKRKKGLQGACLKWALWTDQLPDGRSENRFHCPWGPMCLQDWWVDSLGVDTTSRSFQGYGLNPQKEENLQIKRKSKTFIIIILLCYLFDYNPVFKINIHESILI